MAIPVIVLLALSFAVWGVSDAFTNRAGDSVARVGPERIEASLYLQRFQSSLQTISRESGETLTTQDAREAGLDRQVLDQMIVGAALDAKAGELELGGSDAALAEEIYSIDAFQDTVRGEFSRANYESLLAQEGMTPEQFEEEVRGDIARAQMLGVITPGVAAPASLVDSRQAFRNEQRTVELLVLPVSLAQVEAEPDDDALRMTMEENSSLFTLPERRAVTVVWMDLPRMQTLAEVSDEDVQALFDFRRDSLSTPSTRSFVQIAAPDGDAAEAAAERLRNGESPEAVAADLGLGEPIVQDSAQPIDIVDSAVSEAVFAAGVEPSAFAVEGSLGWAAVQVTGGEEGGEADFDAVAGDLRAELSEDNAVDTLYEAIDAYEDARGAGEDLVTAAQSAGLAAESYAPLDMTARDGDGAVYGDLQAARELLQEIFSLNIGETSELIDLPQGGYAVVRVDRIEPQRSAELDEMREAAEALWRAQREDEALQEIETGAQAQLDGGAGFAETAEAIGSPARHELTILGRGQTAGVIDQRLAIQLFAAEPGELVSGRSASGGRVLARVTAVNQSADADPAASAAISSEISTDLLEQFQNALLEEYEVSVYQEQIDLLFGDTAQ